MRPVLRGFVLAIIPGFSLLSLFCVHSATDLACAQGPEGVPPFRPWPISGGSEELAVVPLPSGGPSVRCGHAAIKDELNNEMVIFGGAYFDPDAWHLYRLNDVWKLDLDSYVWSEISTSGTPPPPLSGHSCVYDPLNHRMLVFGGGFEGGVSGDVYELDLNSYAWKLLPIAGEKPSPRWEHCAVYNSRDHTMAIFGGRDLDRPFNDTWILDLRSLTWERIESYGPSERIAHTGIYIPGRNAMLVFGGSNYWVEGFPYYGLNNELWEFSFDAQGWSELISTGVTRPPARDAHVATYDGVNNRMLIFGGTGYHGVILSDLWELDLTTLVWSRLFPTLSRDRFAGVFNESTQELVFFGGEFHSHHLMLSDGFRVTTPSARPVSAKGDVNCDGEINMADVVCLVSYLFAGGPEPGTSR